MRFKWHEKGGIIEKGELLLDSSHFIDRVILNAELTEKLYHFLFVEESDPEGYSWMCFLPRHLILFYDTKEKIIAFLEVCLSCATSAESEGFKYNIFFTDRIDKLADIFKEAGITYFGENEDLRQ
ncbi:hypothetical protein [Flavobacterium alkalisoli]